MWFWSAFLVAIAVSIDSLGVGVAYGIRRMIIPYTSLVIIGVCSAVLMSISMMAGNVISHILTPQLSAITGGIILVCIGLWQLLKSLRSYLMKSRSAKYSDGTLLAFHFRSLGIVIRILCDPMIADFDHSGEIDAKESIVLGIALGLDAFAAGLAMSMIGFSIGIVPVVAIACMVFVYIGQLFSEISYVQILGQRISLLPGVILIFMGIIKML